MAKKAKKKSVKAAPKRATKKAVKKAAKKTAKKAAPAARAARAAAPRAGFLRVEAGLTVNDIQASIGWYRNVLGCAIGQRWERDGVLTGASMQRDEVTFNLGQDDWKQGRDRVKGQGVRLYVQTGPDIATLAADIKARGGVLTQDLREEWGYRTFSLEDPTGYKITFMCPMS
jgi:uncharacterized glyoxalase superfamily protein PhnB